MAGPVGIPRTARERDHHRDVQLFGQPHRAAKDVVGVRGDGRVGMERVAVAGQGADGQPGVLDHRPVVAGGTGIVEERHRIQVVVPRPAAGAELDCLHMAQGAHLRQHRPDIQSAKHRREHAELHRVLLTTVVSP